MGKKKVLEVYPNAEVFPAATGLFGIENGNKIISRYCSSPILAWRSAWSIINGGSKRGFGDNCRVQVSVSLTAKQKAEIEKKYGTVQSFFADVLTKQ